MRGLDIRNLYYITHIDNLPSILEKGILSHERIENEQLQPARIYNTDIVNRRQEKSTPDQKSLWRYANLYFQPRNPMMYRVVHEKGPKNLVVVSVAKEILQTAGVFIADGNAANATNKRNFTFPLMD